MSRVVRLEVWVIDDVSFPCRGGPPALRSGRQTGELPGRGQCSCGLRTLPPLVGRRHLGPASGTGAVALQCRGCCRLDRGVCGLHDRAGSPACVRSPKRGLWLGEAIGRSRGGLTTKIHLACDGQGKPLAFTITGGNVNDCTQFEQVMARISISRCGPGRPRTRPERVVADKSYSSTKIRFYLRKCGIKAVIPERIDQINGRLRRKQRRRRLGLGECGRQARLASFDEFLEAAARKQAPHSTTASSVPGVCNGFHRADLAARASGNVAGRRAPDVARIGVRVRGAETARRHVVGSLASAGRLAGSNAESSRMVRPDCRYRRGGRDHRATRPDNGAPAESS